MVGILRLLPLALATVVLGIDQQESAESFRIASSRTGRTVPLADTSDSPDEVPKEAKDFIRGVALLLLPEKFEDDDDWGRTTRVQSGVDWDWDGGRLETRRRWKDVNHGSWSQASGSLVDPATTFQLTVRRQPAEDTDESRYAITVSARLRATGRQQQWAWGTRLWSISADAEADVTLALLVRNSTELIKTDDGTRLRLKPVVDSARVNLDSLSVRRVSHLKGSVVRESDAWMERLLKVWIERENKDLAERINKALAKQADEFEVPFEIGSWFVAPTTK